MQKLLRLIFKIYILLLPFQLFPFFYGFKAFFSTAASINNDFFILIIGLVIIILSKNGKILFRKNDLVFDSIKLVLYLVVISIVTSLVLFLPFGTLYGENTLTASFSQNIYLLLCAVTFYFNYYLLNTLKKDEIAYLLDAITVFLIVIGVVDILIITGVPFIPKLYDRLDFFDVLPDSGYMLTMKRICLTSSEPSGIGMTINIFILPYVLGRLTKSNEKVKYYIFVVLLVVICFFTVSSTVYIALFVNFIVYILINSRSSKRKFIALFLLIPAFGVILMQTEILGDSSIAKQIHYVTIEKVTSNENLSTTYRYSTVINDIMCFISYPISGVGNGNQGFLYPSTMAQPFINKNMLNNFQTQKALSGAWGVLSGGAFVPSFISGYGLLGIILLFTFVRKCYYRVKTNTQQMGEFYDMYIIGGITFLCTTTVSGSIEGNFLALFLLSLPFLADNRSNKTGDRSDE